MTLSDYQFELGGVRFGKGCPVELDDEGWDVGADDPQSQDVFNSVTDSFAFGDDALQPSIWTWALHTDDARSIDEALADDRELDLAWKTSYDRRRPGSLAELRYAFAGRTRLVYGRPRRYASGKTNRIMRGYLQITAEFARADTLFYGDEVVTATIGLQPPAAYGLVSPITSPITTLTNTPTLSTTPAVGGDVPTPFIATIHGPTTGSLTNPKISTDTWQLELLTTIEAGSSITIDTHPWVSKATRSDGAVVSSFSARSRFSKARLAPEGETLRFDGIDSSGTATCQIAARPAYMTI